MPYKLFTNCFVSQGYSKDLIIDCHRGNIHPINKELGDYLTLNEIIDFDDFNQEESAFYKKFLIENELIFDFSNLDLKNFPNVDLNFQSPNTIYTIEVKDIDFFHLDPTIYKECNVQNIVIRITSSSNTFLIELEKKMSDYLTNSPVDYLALILDFKHLAELEELIVQNNRISDVKVINAPIETTNGKIRHLADNSKVIRLNKPSISLYCESLKYNTYFNKRLTFLTENSFHFGDKIEFKFTNVVSLKKIISDKQEDPNFIWNISNDKVEICKVCEHKNICLNSQIPKKRQNNWIFDRECEYNPFIGKWLGENGFRTLAACGVISNKNETLFDYDKIAAINEELWGIE